MCDVVCDMVSLINENLKSFDSITDTRIQRKCMESLSKTAVTKLGAVIRNELSDKPYFVDRNAVFNGIMNRAYKTYGNTTLFRSDSKKACIKLSKNMFFAGNGAVIVDTVCHELIHAFLPIDENHGSCFHDAMDTVNRELSIHVAVKGNGGLRRTGAPNGFWLVFCPFCHHVAACNVRRTSYIRFAEDTVPDCDQCDGFLIVRKIPVEWDRPDIAGQIRSQL